MEEISEFEEAVTVLEREMHQLSKIETEAVGVLDEEARYDKPNGEMCFQRNLCAYLVLLKNESAARTTQKACCTADTCQRFIRNYTVFDTDKISRYRLGLGRDMKYQCRVCLRKKPCSRTHVGMLSRATMHSLVNGQT